MELPKELQHPRKGLMNVLDGVVLEIFINKLDYTNVEFPVMIKDIPKVEKQNNINVNVFGWKNSSAFPIYISSFHSTQHKEVINLLFYKNHYVLINNFNRFMYNYTKHKDKKHFCMYCLQCFSSEGTLEKHKNCITVNGKQGTNMPKEAEKVQFKNYHKKLEVPFVIYAEFEAIVEKIHGVKNNPGSSYTDAYQKHKDCSYAYKVVCCHDDQYSKPLQLYRGKNAVYKFIEKMLEEKWCQEILKKHFNKILEITTVEEKKFKQADKCHICGIKYKLCDVRVRDHWHITGKYRGSAHEKCNINYKLTEKIPVIIHNLYRYHSHFIMQEIGKFNRKINVLHIGKPSYIPG